jgi:hypothetical protein
LLLFFFFSFLSYFSIFSFISFISIFRYFNSFHVYNSISLVLSCYKILLYFLKYIFRMFVCCMIFSYFFQFGFLLELLFRFFLYMYLLIFNLKIIGKWFDLHEFSSYWYVIKWNILFITHIRSNDLMNLRFNDLIPSPKLSYFYW